MDRSINEALSDKDAQAMAKLFIDGADEIEPGNPGVALLIGATMAVYQELRAIRKELMNAKETPGRNDGHDG